MSDSVSVVKDDDGYYKVVVKTEDFEDTYEVESPCLTDKQYKHIIKMVKKFNMSEDERIALYFFVKDSLWRQYANKQALYYASHYWIPEENVSLIGERLFSGKRIPTTNFWGNLNG